MTAPEFSARRIGRQWQIWSGEAFYCLASDRYGRALVHEKNGAVYRRVMG